MKKGIALLLSLVMLLGMVPLAALAEEESIPAAVEETEPTPSVPVKTTTVPSLKISGAYVTVGDKINMVMSAKESLFGEGLYTDPYMVFELNGRQTTVTQYQSTGTYLLFTFPDIGPHEMNDEISVTLHASLNGTPCSFTMSYSVAQYCRGRFHGDNDTLKTFMADMLNYGAAAQRYAGHNTDALANESLTDAQKALASADIESYTDGLDLRYETVDAPTARFRSAGMVLNSGITMRFAFSAQNTENLSVKLRDDHGHTWTVDADQLEQNENGDYVVYFSEFNPAQMSDYIYLTVCNGDTPVSNTLRYSVESYAYSFSGSANQKLAELIHCMMKYGRSAKKYVEEGA